MELCCRNILVLVMRAMTEIKQKEPSPETENARSFNDGVSASLEVPYRGK